MRDGPPGAEPTLIRAAGAIVWRPAASGTEIALVHRPKYDDWSFAKGKLLPGEHPLQAAVREVAEETGILVNLGRRLPSVSYVARGEPKVVDYWSATADRGVPEFAANNEVDELAWLPPPEAEGRLSYEHDLGVLAAFRHGPLRTIPLILLRHASAGSKSDWPGPDDQRPLDADGELDAESLATLLRCFGISRAVSSPTERCIATLRPYAAATGGEVEVEPAFRVMKDRPTAGGARRGVAAQEVAAGVAVGVAEAMARLTAAGEPVVICGHRENLPVLLEAACAELGTDAPPVGPLRKGEFLVLQRAGGKLAAAECYSPRERLLPGARRLAARA